MQFVLGIFIYSQEYQNTDTSNLSTLSNIVSISPVYVQFKRFLELRW